LASGAGDFNDPLRGEPMEKIDFKKTLKDLYKI
jgi:hypothetical protein